MTREPKWRFIADALCPHCGQRDKVRLDMHSGAAECVACRRALQRDPPAPPASQARPVRILDPGGE